jgi:hypothetical protein
MVAGLIATGPFRGGAMVRKELSRVNKFFSFLFVLLFLLVLCPNWT